MPFSFTLMEKGKVSDLEDGMDKEVKQDIVDTILEEGVDFAISVSYPNLLHKLKILPMTKKFIIYPFRLGKLMRVAKILAEIDPEQLEMMRDKEEKSSLQKWLHIIVDNKDRLVEVIALALSGRRTKPSNSLIKFLNNNLTSKELFKILILVIRQMDITSFLASMVSVAGLDLIETQKEVPIPGKQLED